MTGLQSSLLVFAALASALRLPLRGVRSSDSATLLQEHLEEASRQSHIKRSSGQQVPISNDPTTSKTPPRASLHPMWNDLLQSVDLTIGTPPQHFRAVIDIAYSGLYFLSAEHCTERTCDDPYKILRYYNASASSTHVYDRNATEDGRAETQYFAWFASGPVASDALEIAGLEIENQSFVEADHFLNQGWLRDAAFDPRSRDEPNGMHRNDVLQNMVAQGLIERPIFGLHPSLDPAQPGWLDLGTVDDRSGNHSMDEIPLSPQIRGIESEADTRWHVNAIALSRPGYWHDLPNRTHAIFDPSLSMIGFPDSIVDTIYEKAGIRFAPLMPWMNCSKKSELDSYDVYLGAVYNPFKLTITPDEFVVEVNADPASPEEKSCYLAVLPVRSTSWADDVIVLGSAFLRAHYAVFDIERQSISSKSI